MNDIYNNDLYIKNSPNLHSEDSKFKFDQIKKILDKIEIFENNLKLLDVGGGAGLLGKMVFDYFSNKGVNVEMHALDLSKEMLNTQKLNNPNIKKILNCKLEDCPNYNYDLVLMIDVIEHIPEKEIAANILNRISKYIVYNVPVEINAFDLLRNIFNKFSYYSEQKRILGHVHFFTKTSVINFLKKHHELIKSFFNPYCFLIKESQYEDYIKLRKSKFRMIENTISCWIYNNFKALSPWLIQGSIYSIVKSNIIKK